MYSYSALLKDLSPSASDARQLAAVPLITTQLELVGNEVLFSLPLMTRTGNLYAAFKEWCQRVVGLTKLIEVFYEGQATLYDQISTDEEISSAVARILVCVESMAKQCIKYKEDNFSKYSDVWTESREAFITKFLQTGRVLSEPDKITSLQTMKKPELADFGE